MNTIIGKHQLSSKSSSHKLLHSPNLRNSVASLDIRAASSVANHLSCTPRKSSICYCKAIQLPSAALQGCDSMAVCDDVSQRDAAHLQLMCLVRIQLCKQAHFQDNRSAHKLRCIPNSTKPISCVSVTRSHMPQTEVLSSLLVFRCASLDLALQSTTAAMWPSAEPFWLIHTLTASDQVQLAYLGGF